MISDPATWVDVHGDRLFRYALSRIRDERAAEDLVQEALITAFTAREKFAGQSAELTWMIGILRNKIFEHLRKQSREAPPISGKDEDQREEANFDNGRHWKPEFEPRDWGPEPQRSAESAEFAAALKKCLEALSPAVSRAFVLREMEGVEPGRCAQALGVPPNHFAVLLYRARMRLRRCLEKNHFAPEAA